MAFINTIVDYLWVFLGSGFTRGVALLNTLIIARMLGPSHFGVFSIFYAIMILTWQLPQAFDGVFVTYAKKYDTKSEKDHLLKTSVVLKLFYLILVIFLSYPLSYILAKYCFQKNEVQIPILVAMLCGVCLMFLMTVASIFQEQERFARFASINAFYSVSIFVFLLAIYFIPFRIEFTLQSVIGIYVIVSGIIGFSSMVLLYQRLGNIFDFDKEVLKTAFAQGKWFFAVVAASCIFSRIDVLFLTAYVDFKNLGIYSVAAQLIMAVDLATGSFAGICLPKAGTAVRSREAFKVFFAESIWAIILIDLGIILFIIIAPHAVIILYGNEYAMAGSLLRVLLYGWIFRVVFVPFSFLFISLGDSRTRFYLELWKLTIGIWLLYLLVPRYGLIGAAYGITLTHFADTLVSIAVLRYRLTRTYRELYLVKSTLNSELPYQNTEMLQ
jgi:O-antigen/teichoic acid export membrane protein